MVTRPMRYFVGALGRVAAGPPATEVLLHSHYSYVEHTLQRVGSMFLSPNASLNSAKSALRSNSHINPRGVYRTATVLASTSTQPGSPKPLSPPPRKPKDHVNPFRRIVGASGSVPTAVPAGPKRKRLPRAGRKVRDVSLHEAVVAQFNA